MYHIFSVNTLADRNAQAAQPHEAFNTKDATYLFDQRWI